MTDFRKKKADIHRYKQKTGLISTIDDLPAYKQCTRKSKFESERIAIINGQKVTDTTGTRFRVYKCPLCKSWHMSSIKDKQ